MNEKTAQYKNHILAALPESVQNHLGPHLQLVKLPFGKVLHESGENIDQIYFPADTIVSLQNMLVDGESTEIVAIGNEGLVGHYMLMGSEIPTTRAVVFSGGSAYRLSGKTFKNEINFHGSLEKLLLRYTQSLMTRMAQAAVCNRHHSIEQLLCRWLLVLLDRIQSHRLLMTHDLISTILGVRRESITDVVGKLRRQGIIECARGKITVLDRPRLETHSCECYSVITTEITNLMSYYATLTPRRYIMRENSGRREEDKIQAGITVNTPRRNFSYG